MIIGIIIIWVCWLFYDGGKTYGMFTVRANASPKIFENTFLAGAAGGLTAFFFKPMLFKIYKKVSWFELKTLVNGIFAGLVSISCGCDRVEPWAAVCIGIIGAFVYIKFCLFLKKKEIDDPLEGSAVHMACGIWGLVASGCFDN